MDLSRFPRRRYTIGATPLEFLPNFTRALSPDGQGPNIWIKRDDMLGLFPGGNKTRKLEFLVADALAQGRRHADHLRRTTVQPLPHHAGSRCQRRAEMPLCDRGAGAWQLP